MKANDAKRLKELERENRELKQIAVEKELENRGLKEIAPGKLVSPARRAYRIAGQHRSTQRHEPRRALDDDAALRTRLREISREKPAGATAAPKPAFSPRAGA